MKGICELCPCNLSVNLKFFHNKKLLGGEKKGEPRRKGRREAEALVWKDRPCGWEGVMLEPLRLWTERPESDGQADRILI